VDFIDVFARKGCRVRGRARYILRDHADAALRTGFRKRWPELYGAMQGFVLVDVTEAQLVTSPAYDVGAVASELTEEWLRRYKAVLRVHRLRRRADILLASAYDRALETIAAENILQLSPAMMNERWSLDFVQDTLESNRRFPALTVVDDFTRESLAIEVSPH